MCRCIEMAAAGEMGGLLLHLMAWQVYLKWQFYGIKGRLRQAGYLDEDIPTPNGERNTQ